MTRRAFDADYAWASALWTECERAASGLDGPAVVAALDRASAAIYNAGYDDAFKRLTRGTGPFSAAAVAAHDVGWLTVWLLELRRARKVRRRRA